MPDSLKIRGRGKQRNAPYPLGEISHSLATEIGKHIVHRIAIGLPDITGDDFGGIFAAAINGNHRNRPLGVADVTWESCAWSVKTVKDNKPFSKESVRVISGRNSPSYSSNISNPFANIQETGNAVLNIWNARLNESLNEHDDLRIFVMIRNMSTLEFTLFEIEATRFVPANYYWERNSKDNLEGYDRLTNAHKFTWQPHGSQLTVKYFVPASAYRFRINRNPGVLGENDVLELIQYDDSWIEPVANLDIP